MKTKTKLKLEIISKTESITTVCSKWKRKSHCRRHYCSNIVFSVV